MQAHDHFGDSFLIVLQMTAILTLLIDIYLDIDEFLAEFVLEFLSALLYF